MKRSGSPSLHVRHGQAPLARGYTIVELLMATTLTLMLMGVVVTILGSVTESVHNSRAMLEMKGRLADAKEQLRQDLEGLTVAVYPPRRPEADEGYLEIIEGPMGPYVAPSFLARNTQRPRTPDAVDPSPFEQDTTVADVDDLLLFTVRSKGRPFTGRAVVKRAPLPGETPEGVDARGPYNFNFITVQSYEAEIIYFVRGRTLFRRMLLVVPGFPLFDPDARTAVSESLAQMSPRGFYNNDVSVHMEFSVSGTPFLVANTLGDLTKPENRYAHRTYHRYSGGYQIGFPFHPHVFWDYTANPPTVVRSDWASLGLPTLRESSYTYPDDPTWDWVAGGPLPRAAGPAGTPARLIQLTPRGTFDAWDNPHPFNELELVTGTLDIPPQANPPYARRFLGQRIAEDVILTNVIGFDIKVWDPQAPVLQLPGANTVLSPGDPGYLTALSAGAPVASLGAYVDLNYAGGNVGSAFDGPGHGLSRLNTGYGGVYDTWSFHYEHDGIDQDGDGLVDEGTNGFDDDGDGVVDDLGELETRPPYPVPLRGIQIKIRTYEPDSRQVREVTVVEDFLLK